MVQYADHASLATSLTTVEQVLGHHASELGHDFIAYRNHVYRVVSLCVAIPDGQVVRRRHCHPVRSKSAQASRLFDQRQAHVLTGRRKH
jgi:hypothetical protein